MKIGVHVPSPLGLHRELDLSLELNALSLRVGGTWIPASAGKTGVAIGLKFQPPGVAAKDAHRPRPRHPDEIGVHVPSPLGLHRELDLSLALNALSLRVGGTWIPASAGKTGVAIGLKFQPPGVAAKDAHRPRPRHPDENRGPRPFPLRLHRELDLSLALNTLSLGVEGYVDSGFRRKDGGGESAWRSPFAKGGLADLLRRCQHGCMRIPAAYCPAYGPLMKSEPFAMLASLGVPISH